MLVFPFCSPPLLWAGRAERSTFQRDVTMDDGNEMISSTDRLLDDYEALCLEPDPPLYAVSEEDSAKNRFR